MCDVTAAAVAALPTQPDTTQHALYYMCCHDLCVTVGSKMMITQKLSKLLVFTPTRKIKEHSYCLLVVFMAN